MDSIYTKAIIAGIVCGIVLVILSFLGLVVFKLAFGPGMDGLADKYPHLEDAPNDEFLGVISLPAAVGLILVALGMLTYFLGGVLAAAWGGTNLITKSQAAVVGLITAIVAEIIHRPFAMAFEGIMDYVHPVRSLMLYSNSFDPPDKLAMGAIFMQAMCCLPPVLIVGIILAIFGALAYAIVKVKA
jgi:hypothetical protein